MPRLQLPTNLPFEVGALYNRRQQIHGLLGGQQQGGISTPNNSPFVILFTGEAGSQHGYGDHWEYEGGENILHYYGEGQAGDMQDSRGNRAIREHLHHNRMLLIFQSLGKSQPYRFLGEFRFIHAYEEHGVPDTSGALRKAIVFKLKPVEDDFNPFQKEVADSVLPEIDLSTTVSQQVQEIRVKQSLFKRRLLNVEKQCRLTGVADLRFLRASHIKPWSKCSSGTERVDGANGLLLTPHADLLFDRGWITFEDNGALVRSSHLPSDVASRIGLDLRSGRRCGGFDAKQKTYLEYHRNAVFETTFKKIDDPLSDLVSPALY
ncbi:HNH endonuclease [Luteimonas sp. 100069]|uniref:HNH endonuclease n=1 Tax=Luteimonas sp. 100069 TaxID=2006109 RepID=UPI000F4DD645|nr:HNH endonuclease [Luteimonas sp. 100069]RPD83905.1 HNH endonuclease [Luteimonas sp. 100069]